MELYYEKGRIECGCDEAGRGCVAGPVYAAAVIWPTDLSHPELRDSKKIDEKTRYELREYVMENAVAYGIASVSPEEIDEINILRASFKAMHKAIGNLTVTPDLLLIDGNKFDVYKEIPHKTIIGGDDIYFSIAAASILAKTSRDSYMIKMAEQYPDYHWKGNKGYGTKAHVEAIREHGYTPLHRKSFHIKSLQKDLFSDFSENSE